MYSTCLFCQHDLGRNETFEAFPIGRRLAFDADRGRLWVVCRNCARWNLTPLEERWEAIEEAERRFRATTLRAGTGEISLARLREGTELVRIGTPPAVELAAWRYGDQFGRRRKRNLLVAGAVAAGGVVALGGAVASGMGLILAWQLGAALHRGVRYGAPWSTVARVRARNGRVITIRPGDLQRTELGRNDDGALTMTVHRRLESRLVPADAFTLTGAEARTALAQVLPGVNRMGGTEEEVRRALARLDDAGSVERFFDSIARSGSGLTPIRVPRMPLVRRAVGDVSMEMQDESGLFALPASLRLAIEMAANEERERQAMEGDLASLEDAWREAEELAAIADDLLLPAGVEERMARMRAKLPRARSN